MENEKMLNFTQIKNRLLKLDTTHLCDASPKVLLLDQNIRAMISGIKLVGIARIVDCQGDILPVMKALHDAIANEVLIISTGGSTKAVAGEMFAAEAKRKNLAGFIINGACRDIDALHKIQLPIYARSICAQAGGKIKTVTQPVSLNFAGVTITTGDYIYGDANGIVVIKPDDLLEILEYAEAVQCREEHIIQQINAGKSLFDMFNFAEYYEKIKQGKEGKISFVE